VFILLLNVVIFSICLPLAVVNWFGMVKNKILVLVNADSNIKIADEGVTNEKKQALIKGTTQLLVDVLNKNPGNDFFCDRRSQHRQLGY